MQTKIPLSLFTLSNHLSSIPTPFTTPLTLTATPVTDLWRKPGIIAHTFPSLFASIKLSSFHHARVTFHAPWKTLYDQGGVAFIFPPSKHDQGGHPPRWIKAGVEHVGGVPRVSIVAADKGSWSDWSVGGPPEGTGLGGANVTLEMVREGPSLIINVVEGNIKSIVREITWVFEDELLKQDPVVEVGAYVAKPTPEEGDDAHKKGIKVTFEELEVWRN
ncbi:hypothetical protein Q9L58_007013 [Maublancomyces gigas]|uniref:Uncharacterized protein n=1 Tax=Discina gigas TaxID=1032678 RepID=A0ABR3GDU7_9PEZI